MLRVSILPLVIFGWIFAALPASSHYELQSYGVGSGGTANSVSGGGNYGLEGITGETSGSQLVGSAYNVNPAFISTQQADVPAVTLTNDGGANDWYNKLHLVINPYSNPSDATYAIAISDDNWVTTNYIQSDNTVGSALGSEDRRTYASFGSGSGFDIVGLNANTTYKAKAKAYTGRFTESAYGPVSTASTVNPSLTFDIDVSASDTETGPPFSVSFGDLLAGSIINSPVKIWTDFDTNGASGGNIYIYGDNNGLKSTATNNNISLSSNQVDLTGVGEGFGALSQSATQSAGGPIAAQSPYDASAVSDIVGKLDTSVRPLYSTAAKITAGRTSLILKAKTSTTTPAAVDYQDILTVLAAASF